MTKQSFVRILRECAEPQETKLVKIDRLAKSFLRPVFLKAVIMSKNGTPAEKITKLV